MLVREHAARINICSFCMDIGRWMTIKGSMNQAKFDALEQYNTNPLFTDAERAALDYVTELTKNKRSIEILLHVWQNTIPNVRSVRLYGLLPANIFTI
jgi:alkylhydroperoxidase family enzyme